MDVTIITLPDAPLPLDPDSAFEVDVPDGSSATGYTSCVIYASDLFPNLEVKEYKGLLNSVGGGLPTFDKTNLKLNLGTGVTISGQYDNPGEFRLIASAAVFTANKTMVKIGSAWDGNDGAVTIYEAKAYRLSTTEIRISVATPAGVRADGFLTNTSIHIEVFP